MRACSLLALLPLVASAASGDAVCATCHTAQTSHFRTTPMAQALDTVAACDILKQHPVLTFQEGAYQTHITRRGDSSTLSVTKGTEAFTVPLLWAFGGRPDLCFRVWRKLLREPSEFFRRTGNARSHHGGGQ